MQITKARCIDNKQLKEQVAATRIRKEKKLQLLPESWPKRMKKDKNLKEVLKEISVGYLLDEDSD